MIFTASICLTLIATALLWLVSGVDPLLHIARAALYLRHGCIVFAEMLAEGVPYYFAETNRRAKATLGQIEAAMETRGQYES